MAQSMYTDEEQNILDAEVAIREKAVKEAYQKGARDALQGMENAINNYVHNELVRGNVRRSLLILWAKLVATKD